MDILKDWLTTFWKVIIKPTPETFIEESKKAQGKLSTAIAWLVFSILFDFLFSYFAHQFLFPPAIIIGMVMFFPIAFLVFVFFIHLFYQRLFRRKKDLYSEFLYLSVGVMTPISLINLLVPLIPNVGLALAAIVWVYLFVLIVIAVKAVSKLNVWQSTLTVFLGLLFASLGFLCIPAFILSMMNAVPGTIF